MADAVDRASGFEVRWDDDGVSCRRPDGTVESVEWTDIEEIWIQTLELDPFGNDVWLVISGAVGGVAVPQGAPFHKELLFDVLARRFSPFDHDAIINAMSSVTPDRFTCWRRPE